MNAFICWMFAGAMALVACGGGGPIGSKATGSSSSTTSTGVGGSGTGDSCTRTPGDDTSCKSHDAATPIAFHCPDFPEFSYIGPGPACYKRDGPLTKAGTWCCPDEPIVNDCQKEPQGDSSWCSDKPGNSHAYSCWWTDHGDQGQCCVNGINTSCCPVPPSADCARTLSPLGGLNVEGRLRWCCAG